jgi:3-oxoacyl-[acyl-carrier-protein] synthase-3
MTTTLPRYTRITGTGSYLPARRVSNAQLAQELAERGVETSDPWIVERTGIRARHFAAEGEVCSDLALAASRAALQSAGRNPADVDLIIVATSTPDMVFPSPPRCCRPSSACKTEAPPSTCRRCVPVSSTR